MKKIAIILLYLVALTPQSISAQNAYGFTEEDPLIVACDWDFQPFEFLNSEGEPTGYNIDVLELNFKELNIPHKYVMQEWYIASQMFEHHEADLIHALTFNHMRSPYVMTKNFINYYNLKVARKIDTPPFTKVSHLGPEDTIHVKNNDYAALRLQEVPDHQYTVEFHSPKDGLTNVRTGAYKYYVWGEVPLASKIRELDIDSVVLDEIDIPAGELRIIGYDKNLVDLIDDEFARLEQAGKLTKIRDKWFHPERVHNDTSPMALLIILGTFIFGCIAFLLSRIIRLRVKKTYDRLIDLNNMRKMALGMGEYYVIEWDIATDMLQNKYGDMLPDGAMSPQEFVSRMGPGQGQRLHELNKQLALGKIDRFDLHLSLNLGTEEHPRWKEYYGNAISEMENGKLKYIVYTAKDITKETYEEHMNQKMANKYQQMFETNLLAMSFYDIDGKVIDLNQKMRNLCGFDEGTEAYFRQTSLFDIPLFKGDFDLHSDEPIHVCQHMHYPEMGIDKYIEFRVKPLPMNKDVNIYYVITARDVTAERNIYVQQRQHDLELQKSNKMISEFEVQLRYLLEQSDMFVWRYLPQEQAISFARSLHDHEYKETIDEFFAGVFEEERKEAMDYLRTTIKDKKPFNAIHHYKYTPFIQEPAWYSISGVPSFAKDGTLIEYFGIARNITDLLEAQQKLKEETARAEDSGRMKAAFLANMTHEIRTPLNAIVGFSDILQMVETPEERMEFIRIIRNNCDMLLRLINDILEASSMGQALAIEPETCDFSQVFDDICQTLEQRVAESGVPFIKDNPYPTFTATLDKGRIQQVLTNFTTNAVKYTKTGHIKVGYRQQDGGIYFYCEDTGAGIPKDKQAAVFERFVKLNDFVQGTGLGLSICKNIAERCGGKIGVTSEGEGHGSTFWMWIPM